MILNVLKVFGLSAFAFFIGIAVTPALTHFLYRRKMWRKEQKEYAPDGTKLEVYKSLKKNDAKKIPRMGGILVWLIPLLVIFLMYFIARLHPSPLFQKLNFLSRNQTWLPLFTLVAASLVGLADDLFQIFGKGKYIAGGLRFSRRLILIVLIALAGAFWFYFKLETDSIFVPFFGDLFLWWLFIPFFVLVTLGSFSSSVIDGLDGLSGGVMATIFAAYSGVAFFQNQMDLAAFSAVIAGSILAFLWFNIPPARFYMSETGMFGLTTTLTVIAFLTDTVLILPIIALPLVITSLSVIIQFASKKIFHKKVFLVAPLHHHFEAKGWPHYKMTMRYWILTVVFAIIGLVTAIISK